MRIKISLSLFLFVLLLGFVSMCSAAEITQEELNDWNFNLKELRSINKELKNDLILSKQELIQVRTELVTYQRELLQVRTELIQSSNELKLAKQDFQEANKLLKTSKEFTTQLSREVNSVKLQRNVIAGILILSLMRS